MKLSPNHHIRPTIIIVLALLMFCLPVLGDHGTSQKTNLDDGGIVTSKSFKSSKIWVIYKSIGGKSTVKGKNKKRKWWCAWLCKRQESKDADRIEIQNTYYSEVSPGLFATLERGPKVCTNTSSCEQKEWAFGVGIKVKFPNGGTPTPSQLDSLLPIEGVITRHLVDVDGRIIRNTTSKGKHPLAAPVIQ